MQVRRESGFHRQEAQQTKQEFGGNWRTSAALLSVSWYALTYLLLGSASFLLLLSILFDGSPSLASPWVAALYVLNIFCFIMLAIETGLALEGVPVANSTFHEYVPVPALPSLEQTAVGKLSTSAMPVGPKVPWHCVFLLSLANVIPAIPSRYAPCSRPVTMPGMTTPPPPSCASC